MTVLELFSSRLRTLALVGMAGALGVMSAVQVSSAQTAPSLKPDLTPPIVAQQLVTLPAEPVSFVVEQWTVPAESITIDSSGPGFLIGSTGSAVVASERTGHAVFLSAGEAAPLYADDRYQAKSQEPASIWTIGLQQSSNADASFVG